MSRRCPWAEINPLMIDYHDREWGVPVHDDRELFEYLVLDAFQAGLSWAVVLNKREAFREAFAGFDPQRVARFTDRKIERLMENPKIIRNRRKIVATVRNAQAFLGIQDEHGTFDGFIWSIVGGATRQNHWRTPKQIPTHTAESDRMSNALREKGFSFVGSTICYAFMQAAGMVNDHLVGCFRYGEVSSVSESASGEKVSGE